MSRGGMWFPSGRPRQASLPCTAGPYFQLCIEYFSLGLFCKQRVPTELTSFPPSLSLSSPMTSPLVFQMTDQSLEGLVFSIQHILSPFSHVISGFIPSFLLPSLFATWLYFFWFTGTVPPNTWMWVNFLKHCFIHIFLQFSSNSLSLMNQVQILYLGIPSLSISL